MEKILVVLVGFLASASAQVTQFGRCSGIHLVNDFDLESFFGSWYEIGKISNQYTSCSSLQFYQDPTVGVAVTNQSMIHNFPSTDAGYASYSSGTAEFILFMESGLTNFWILDTDYNNYAIAISCDNLGLLRRTIGVWQLGRALDSFATQEIVEKANSALQTISMSLSDLQSVDHSAEACTELPEIVPGTPIILPGQCTNINPVQNFQVAKFTGTWHEIASYYWENAVGSCARVKYSQVGSTVEVVHSRVLNQHLDTVSGTAALVGTDGSGVLSVVLDIDETLVTQQLYILNTDYTGYAITYICENVGTDQRRVYSWILSRKQQITPESQIEVNRVINSFLDLNTEYFQVMPQTRESCFYYPDFQEGVPVVFPGQCDMSIPVQANFDSTRYVNLWHDVESYPSTTQQGTCNNAFYSLVTDSFLNVMNTQVVDQRLDTVRGYAAIFDVEETAKLFVTLPDDNGGFVSTDYWILATDYDSYSLVYTCVNLTNNLQAVFSWKLSRTKFLTDEANQAIDAVIATIPVLDSRYFSIRDQSVDGCFYFPDALPNTPVVFPGQCDITVNAINAFNVAGFAGVWHEVEAYPTELQTGSCINHEFTTVIDSPNTLDVVSNQIVNFSATSAFGSMTLESTDGSAWFRLTMNVNGETISMPFWILDIVYNDYALAYSCININADFKTIYSWKLSRTQTLSTEAHASINNFMATHPLLENKYFEAVDQSEKGCATYPDIPVEDPIILPGQCGTVSPVTNFQADMFAGTWYELARYPSERQSGDCAIQEFTIYVPNYITLTNTIVSNQRLVTVSGPAFIAPDGTGVLDASFTDEMGLFYNSMIYILDTDYTEFAVLYSCENIQGTNNRQIYAWKLSRTESGFSQAAVDRISQVEANNADIHEDYFRVTGHSSSECFYYPVFDETPESIILPGTCPIINGLESFSPDDYAGNWYHVASYPTSFHGHGTCPRTQQFPGYPYMNIRTTTVVDRALKTINAMGRTSIWDDIGMIEVVYTLENEDESQFTFYIIDTDYTSYSLIYSCLNLSPNTRRVFSWKLSRTPTLSPEASIAINNVISNTEGLLEEYYVETSQSAEDCFYVPENVPGQPVLFRGACEAVTSMEGFNPSQYLGWWHEIERYPSDNVPGQCTSAHFAQSGDAFSVMESSIEGGIPNESTYHAVISSDGTITIQRSAGPTVWHVLDTDYDSYSLLYACEDVATDWGDYRRVWSAKHSKARSLTEAAENAINSVIATNDLLYQQFYETVNQSDAACLHSREYVILPGQCDEEITVQDDFDMSRFSGIWYQHERYPYVQVSNDATCVGARYTVSGSSVNVLNWEQLDGTLNTIGGSATVDPATATLTITLGEDTKDLRILATDYEDYALAYTCVNINEIQRLVGAFKLSRSRTLSSDGHDAIETYMADRQELHQHYFISIEQHDECPNSALWVQSSVIVMLVSFALQLVM